MTEKTERPHSDRKLYDLHVHENVNAMHASDVAVITGKTFAGQKLDFGEMLLI